MATGNTSSFICPEYIYTHCETFFFSPFSHLYTDEIDTEAQRIKKNYEYSNNSKCIHKLNPLVFKERLKPTFTK